ncbi:MAG TPA: metalloregulator ArsR/SmtB family transcription factor [Solirubrobacterales bacterium]|nr:metalloregulator ArsR/SmtB family transcription factor [Solirubrobacterales bacterium]
MSHGAAPDPRELLDPRAARQVAETMQALATPSRLRILACLHEGPRSVSEIGEAVGMDGSAVSHQLRILRHLGLVTGERDGRRVNYSLYDHHVAQLLEQAMSHVEHLRLGLAEGTRREDAALSG